MKAFARFLRLFVALTIFLCETATLQGVKPKWRIFKCRMSSSRRTSRLKTEHAVGPLRGTDEPYNSVTMSIAGQTGMGVTPGKKSLQDVVDLEKHSATSRHQKGVVSDRNSEAKLNALTPVSTRQTYLLLL